MHILFTQIIKKKKIWFLLFCDFFMTFYFEKNDVNVPSKSNKKKNFFLLTS